VEQAPDIIYLRALAGRDTGRTADKEKALISQGFLDNFGLHEFVWWCPEPESNRYSLAAEGF
jgi:hypothetical protein